MSEINKIEDSDHARCYMNFLRYDGLPEPMHDYTFQRDDVRNEAVSAAMKNYVAQWLARRKAQRAAQREKRLDDLWAEIRKPIFGLLLYGDVGTGKTFYAACIANALIDARFSVKMITATEACNEMFSKRETALKMFLDCDLLIPDDFGAHRQTDYIEEQLFAIIDGRYRAASPLILTTNKSIEEIKNPVGLQNIRICDRILEVCHPVHIGGSSRRRDAVPALFKDRQQILGLSK